MGRLNSRGRKSMTGDKMSELLVQDGFDPIRSDCPEMLDIWQVTMSDMPYICRKAVRYMRERNTQNKLWRLGLAIEALGIESRVRQRAAESDGLIEQAIQFDPRLARRSTWRRGEEGEIGCPALIAQGEDNPYFYRSRTHVTEANGGEPVRVVISTDSNAPSRLAAAALIATIRIVQQFRPVYVWWQGAWLSSARRGWVFHVPLVQGDMDFTRLDFCINSMSRDSLSWMTMFVRALEVTKCIGWAAGHAERSYLAEESYFVPHSGVSADPEYIARTAARWLGLESIYSTEIDGFGALQSLPHVVTEEDRREQEEYARKNRKRREKEDREREREMKRETAAAQKARLQNVNIT